VLQVLAGSHPPAGSAVRCPGSGLVVRTDLEEQAAQLAQRHREGLGRMLLGSFLAVHT
jgi:hypothetical protein